MERELTEKEQLIKDMIYKKGITLIDMIDFIIEENGIVGVGYISLADGLSSYIKDKIK